MKALYFVLAREPPPYTHRVSVLYNGLKRYGFSLPRDLEESIPILNKYYTITKYPDAANGLPSEAVDREEAERAYNIARRVVEFVKEAVQGYSS